jgi:hypothetical protein
MMDMFDEASVRHDVLREGIKIRERGHQRQNDERHAGGLAGSGHAAETNHP